MLWLILLRSCTFYMQLPYKRYPISTIRCRCRDAQLYNIGIFQGCMLCWQVSAAVHCSGPLAMASPITIFKCIIVPAALVCRKDTEAKHPKLIASPAGHQWVLLQYREGSTQPITGVTQSLLLRAMITRSVCVRLAQVSVHYPGYACTEHFFVIPSIRPPRINPSVTNRDEVVWPCKEFRTTSNRKTFLVLRREKLDQQRIKWCVHCIGHRFVRPQVSISDTHTSRAMIMGCKHIWKEIGSFWNQRTI